MSSTEVFVGFLVLSIFVVGITMLVDTIIE